MTRKRNNNRNASDYKSLENRCLLAADVGFTAAFEFDLSTCQEVEAVDVTETSVDRAEVQGSEFGSLENEALFAAHSLDLSDGADGMFGELTEDQPEMELTLTAPEDGIATLVVSSSFGDGETNLNVEDHDGELVAKSSTEALTGFQQISFQVNEGEVYAITIGGDDAIGNFQATVEFVADPPEDLHVNFIGPEATAIDIVNHHGTISGELEHEGDVDVFQYVATGDGEASLFAGESIEENGSQLHVSVMDANGNEVASGSTNEFVETGFQVQQGETYYLAVQVGEGQMGAYNLAVVEDVVSRPADLHADEVGSEATLLEGNDRHLFSVGSLETAEDRDAFRFIAPQTGTSLLSGGAIDRSLNASPNATDGKAIAESHLTIKVFNQAGELIAQAGSNQFLGLSFDTVEGGEYQVLVDSANDTPMDYFFDIVSAEVDPLLASAIGEGGVGNRQPVNAGLHRYARNGVQASESQTNRITLDETFAEFEIDLLGEFAI